MIFARVSFRLFFVCMLASASVAFAQKAKPTRPGEAGVHKGYIAIDAATGATLLEDNADVVAPPASMTKLMTFAIVHDKLVAGEFSLSTPIQIDTSDARMGGTQVYLDPRETFSVEELLYALMIQSANDAAHALARIAGGSVPGFVNLMNEKARELGMTRTTFRSPHGLPPSSRKEADGDLTSPRDFAILCRYLLTQTNVLKYSSVRERPFGQNRANGPLQMRNHNNLLGKVAGVDGLKTGYTKSAGYCLSATAQRNNRRVIVVIMGAFGPGGEVDLGRSRDRKTIALIEEAFGKIPANSPAFTSSAPLIESPIEHAPIAAPAEDEAPVIKFSIPKKTK
ncbi:MAG: D-alanyl-D-alanine carboxypeptidase [Opitutus sp.]|nr:D-alanyl-D-alanine carboxypeptidase [Opitutus sp.]